MLKNKKGFIHMFYVAYGLVPTIFLGAFTVIGAIALWHIPAWEKAKSAHCEAAYQSGDMNCGDKK